MGPVRVDDVPGVVLVLPDPQALPTGRGDLARGVSLLSDLGIHDAVLSEWPGNYRAVARILDGVGWRSGARERPQKVRRKPARTSLSRREHDQYFGVIRVSGPGEGTFLLGLVAGVLNTLDYVDRFGTGLSESEWQSLTDLPGRMISYALGKPFVHRDAPVRRRDPVDAEETAAFRWRVGHQLFFVVIQALGVSVSCAIAAAEGGQRRETATALELAGECARAAAASLKFASEFSATTYAERIRPAMMPPHVGPGFSGFATRDHQWLLKVFKRLHSEQPRLASTGEPYTRFVAEVGDMYSAHVAVCAHFSGGCEPSLRMQALRDGTFSASGVDVAGKLAKVRMRLFKPPRQRRPHG